MAMAIDVGQLVKDITDAASGIIKSDVTQLGGFSKRQVEAIAHQASLVSAGIISGEITAETRDFFLDGLKDMSRNFVNTLVGMSAVTVEKVWNAVVGVIWKAISTAAGVVLKV
jgi:hypothetical protein